nr:helix-turn-helix transcriptional regulator [Micromonospora inaquosa]
MPARRESFVQTLRAQWLGQQMRQLREQRGITLKQAAEFLERDFSSIARWERAEWPFRRGVVVSLLDLYGEHDGRERNRFIQLAEDAWRTHLLVGCLPHAGAHADAGLRGGGDP